MSEALVFALIKASKPWAKIIFHALPFLTIPPESLIATRCTALPRFLRLQLIQQLACHFVRLFAGSSHSGQRGGQYHDFDSICEDHWA